MKISIVTDEISADPETAIELGVSWGVRDFELRGFGTDRVPLFSTFQKDRLAELVAEHRINLIAISPGLFKIPYPISGRQRFAFRTLDADLHQKWQHGRDLLGFHLQELLPLSIEYARQIGVDLISTFGFHRGGASPGPAPDGVLEALRQAAKQVGEAEMRLAIEVEDGFWADTGARTAEIVRQINEPALGINWDPGNSLPAGETPYPDGYQAVRDLVRHVHFKDVIIKPDGGYEYVLEGDIDWAGQISALADDNYPGYISVETHLQPKVHCAQVLTKRLQGLIAASRE